jgi:hypothetical protein
MNTPPQKERKEQKKPKKREYSLVIEEPRPAAANA